MDVRKSDERKQSFIMDNSSEADNSTIYTTVTPPESVTADYEDDYNHAETTAPSSGSTFIIRSVLSGDVITLSRWANHTISSRRPWV
jgi:hypothetical protein